MNKNSLKLARVAFSFSPVLDQTRFLMFYIDHCLDRWSTRYPKVKIDFQEWRFTPYPEVIFYYRDDSIRRLSLSNCRPQDIEIILNMGVNSGTGRSVLVHGKAHTMTVNDSVQGRWSYSLASAQTYLRKKLPIDVLDPNPPPISTITTVSQSAHKTPLHRCVLPMYSDDSLSLASEALQGNGRWGPEYEFPKGGCLRRLEDVLDDPLILPDEKKVAPPHH
eukprot:GHVN01017569.1.p1 GENE.GHVN01017569.1~~GHVN01017569.1.p1  ORF type:complete len:252 (-),score=46.00 GHVN01017569.1:220-879(-)